MARRRELRSGAGGPLDRYVLLSRATLATIALGLSIRTYWHSWHWL